MPEGDTIHKVAQFMAPRLQGATLISCQVSRLALVQLARQRIKRVFARGKHLFIDCGHDAHHATRATGYGLRVHLGMHGSWHVYPQGAPYKRPAWQATVVLLLADGTRYVCFNAEDVELIDAAYLPQEERSWRRLGPDLLQEPPDFAHIIERFAKIPEDMRLIDILLNQQVAAGIGNVYKCELMFLHALPVETCYHQISRNVLETIYRRAAALLRQNMGGWPRTTTCDRRALAKRRALKRPRLWVYGRAGQPCLVCEQAIVQKRMGHKLRQTFWCPSCQRDLHSAATHQRGLVPAIVDAFLPP